MNAKKINTLFKHPEQITSEDLIGLKQAVDDFPYAAPLHALYMKALQKKESYLLPGQIKRAAIATPNRAALKEFHDMPIPGMESAKEVPVVDFTEVAEAGKVEEVEVEAKATEKEITPEQKIRIEKKAEEPAKKKVEKAPEPAKPKTEKKQAVKAEAEAQKSEAVKPKTEVKEPVKLDTPEPKGAPAKPTAVPEDVSHLPEAVRNAILRSRALRGEKIPTSSPKEKKPVQVEKIKDEPVIEKTPEAVVPPQTTPVKEEVKPRSTASKAPKKKQPKVKAEVAPTAPKPKVGKKEKAEARPAEEKLEVREMPFSEKASFMEWLTADFSDGEPKKVGRSVPKDVKTIIGELPKFPVPKKDGKIDVFHLPSNDQGKFVTETLAEIYLKQGLWDKAINAYEVLSLKYPEKSGFFADRIKEIKKHKK
jgi:hypothetical protein